MIPRAYIQEWRQWAPWTQDTQLEQDLIISRALVEIFNHPLLGDRDPRSHEFSVQLRAFDAAKSGASVGVAVLLALSSALLQKSLKGGMAIVGGLNLGGSTEPVYNAVNMVEIAIEKGGSHILMPVSARKQLNDMPDDLATKINVYYYSDSRDALIKALME